MAHQASSRAREIYTTSVRGAYKSSKLSMLHEINSLKISPSMQFSKLFLYWQCLLGLCHSLAQLARCESEKKLAPRQAGIDYASSHGQWAQTN